MKFDAIRRRMFLTGAGALVAMPLLPSLLPRTVRADPTRPVRYVQMLNPYGANTQAFYGLLRAMERIDEHVMVQRLRDVDGDISPLVGPAFTPLKEKFSLVHGMDVIAESNNHNMCFPTCASGYASGLDGDEHPPLSGQPSVDVLMSRSSLVYGPSTPIARRLLVLNPLETDGYTITRSFSWQQTPSGSIEMIRPTKTTMGLTDILASGFGDVAPEDPNEELLLNAVYDDYRRVRDSTRISAADRNRLEAYMALIQDIARSAGGGGCVMPTFADETDIDVVVTNQFKLLTAAMLCDLTRVASVTLGMTASYEGRHPEHHDRMASANAASGVPLYDDLIVTGRRVAELVTMFEEAPDMEGTLLDNSMIYWGMQYGNARIGDVHRPLGMPVLVAGSAGGQLQTGVYLDYRRDPYERDNDEPVGLPINNLLVTFMNCMGMGSSHYEAEGRAGYGYYNTAFFENPVRPNPEHWSGTEGRRSPLPYFYTGTARG